MKNLTFNNLSSELNLCREAALHPKAWFFRRYKRENIMNMKVSMQCQLLIRRIDEKAINLYLSSTIAFGIARIFYYKTCITIESFEEFLKNYYNQNRRKTKQLHENINSIDYDQILDDQVIVKDFKTVMRMTDNTGKISSPITMEEVDFPRFKEDNNLFGDEFNYQDLMSMEDVNNRLTFGFSSDDERSQVIHSIGDLPISIPDQSTIRPVSRMIYDDIQPESEIKTPERSTPKRKHVTFDDERVPRKRPLLQSFNDTQIDTDGQVPLISEQDEPASMQQVSEFDKQVAVQPENLEVGEQTTIPQVQDVFMQSIVENDRDIPSEIETKLSEIEISKKSKKKSIKKEVKKVMIQIKKYGRKYSNDIKVINFVPRQLPRPENELFLPTRFDTLVKDASVIPGFLSGADYNCDCFSHKIILEDNRQVDAILKEGSGDERFYADLRSAIYDTNKDVISLKERTSISIDIQEPTPDIHDLQLNDPEDHLGLTNTISSQDPVRDILSEKEKDKSSKDYIMSKELIDQQKTTMQDNTSQINDIIPEIDQEMTFAEQHVTPQTHITAETDEGMTFIEKELSLCTLLTPEKLLDDIEEQLSSAEVISFQDLMSLKKFTKAQRRLQFKNLLFLAQDGTISLIQEEFYDLIKISK